MTRLQTIGVALLVLSTLAGLVLTALGILFIEVGGETSSGIGPDGIPWTETVLVTDPNWPMLVPLVLAAVVGVACLLFSSRGPV